MALRVLGSGDVTRFEMADESVIAEVALVESDAIDLTVGNKDLEVVVPVYGARYLRYNNPYTTKVSQVSIGLQLKVEAYESLCAAFYDSLSKVSLVFGGDVYPKKELVSGVFVSVSGTRSMINSKALVLCRVVILRM